MASARWWETAFDAWYLREYAPLFDLERDRREVTRLVELLELPSGARILDVPCGQGRHAHLLAEAGFDVTGVDFSRYLIARAKERGTGKTLRYQVANMKKLPAGWRGRFDAVVNLFTSFGFFDDPADDQRTIDEFARVLRPGGVLIWHGASRDGVAARFLGRDWWPLEDGTVIGQERRFDPLAGRLHVHSRWHGPDGAGQRDHAIRLYTATRLSEMCAAAGLIVEQAFGGWRDRALRRRDGEMLLVARRESSSQRVGRSRTTRRARA